MASILTATSSILSSSYLVLLSIRYCIGIQVCVVEQ